MEPDLVAQAATGLAANDYSIWSLVAQADLVVKGVLLTLVGASFWSWAIIFEKSGRIGKAARKSDNFEQVFWSGKSLDDLYQNISHKPDNPMAVVFVAAMREWRRSFEGGSVSGDLAASVRERIDKVMSVTLTREVGRLEKRLGFLATVGSTAPFVGLFGTVWGIMNSFQDIAANNDTNLATVAPGIAEALFATALGLVAAIPAVVAYNKFSNDLSRYSLKLEGFADEFSAILSRQLDERAR